MKVSVVPVAESDSGEELPEPFMLRLAVDPPDGTGVAVYLTEEQALDLVLALLEGLNLRGDE